MAETRPIAPSRIQRVVFNYLVQGFPIEGEHVDESSDGITVRDEKGVDRFVPWTSVAYVIRNPEKVVDDQF